MSHPAWSDLHDLALVYLAFVYSTEREKDAGPQVFGRETSKEPPAARREEARRRLVQRHPEVGEERLRRIFHEAFLMYVGTARAPMLDVAVASLHRALPRPRRVAVLDDLTGLAADDGGDLRASGASFIQYLAFCWELEPMPGRPE